LRFPLSDNANQKKERRIMLQTNPTYLPTTFPFIDIALREQPTEEERFARLQKRLAPMFRRVFFNPQAPRTVIVVPSLSFDARELAKISGIHHYEERMLCLLMLLQLPRTRIVYITSQPINEAIVDYYLHLLPGIPGQHARRRPPANSAGPPG
jgi:hypothetical protein